MKKQEWCQKCGKLRGNSKHESLCQKCVKSLPQCYICTIICGAKKWGYHDEEETIHCILKKSGEKIILCGSCNEKRLENQVFIAEKVGKIPAEDIISAEEAKLIELVRTN